MATERYIVQTSHPLTVGLESRILNKCQSVIFKLNWLVGTYWKSHVDLGLIRLLPAILVLTPKSDPNPSV